MLFLSISYDIRYGCWQFGDIRQFQDLAAQAAPMGREYYRTLSNFDKSDKGGRSMPVISLFSLCRRPIKMQTRTCACCLWGSCAVFEHRLKLTCINVFSIESAFTHGSDFVSTGRPHPVHVREANFHTQVDCCHASWSCFICPWQVRPIPFVPEGLWVPRLLHCKFTRHPRSPSPSLAPLPSLNSMVML